MTLVVIEPTFGHYEDTGCVESPTCLVCPLEKCKHDDPIWYRKEIRKRRDAEMGKTADLLMERMPNTEAVARTAALYGVNERTIWRALRRRSDGT